MWEDTGGGWACLGLKGQQKGNFFLGESGGNEEYLAEANLSERGPVLGQPPQLGAAQQTGTLVSSTVGGLVALWGWAVWVAGRRTGDCPLAREHWRFSLCTLYVSQLSLELCEVWPCLIFLSPWIWLKKHLKEQCPCWHAWYGSCYQMAILSLVATDIHTMQLWVLHGSDWIELSSLEQKEAIQAWICEACVRADVFWQVNKYFKSFASSEKGLDPR